MFGGDGMQPEAREIAERELGMITYSTLQSSELGRIGWECERRSGFHLNTDLIPLRALDPDGREVAPGEPGELVASSLENRAMVLLNYRFGDFGAIDPRPCACGRTLPVLRGLQGRRPELLTFANGRVIAIQDVAGVVSIGLRAFIREQWDILGPDRVHYRFMPAPGTDPATVEPAMRERARAAFGDQLALTVECVDDLPLTAAGKFRRVVVSAPAPGERPASTTAAP